MFKKILQEHAGKQEPTEYIHEKEQTEYIYKKKQNEYINKKAKIRELYIQMNEHIFATDLSHYFFKLTHTMVREPKH